MNGLERDLAITNIEANGDRADCVHHWIIETPNGPTSEGICKGCSASRLFPNAIEETSVLSKGHNKTRYMAGLASMSLDTGNPDQTDLHKSLLRGVKL